ncbi:MAG: tRNA pseudouridine(54/55) synthase Pus10 [Halobacteriales archaeon]
MTVLEDARRVMAQEPICDACVGRPFADRSFGLTNAERGKALRVTAALEEDDPYEPGEETCWVCEGRCGEFDRWANRAANELSGIEFSTYQVGTRVTPLIEENGKLLREDAGLAPDAGERFKSECNREVGKRVEAKMDAEVDFERPDVVAMLDLESERVDLRINPAFVYGRYRKLERGIPQTEWPCRECGGSGYRDGEECDHCEGQGYMYEQSVEELVAPAIQEAMEGTDATFHGAGREDVDARMLGEGRPFVVEVSNPRTRSPDVAALETEINETADGNAEVRSLELATYEMVERVKELDANKTYRAEVAFSEPVAAADLESALEELNGTTIHQDTPKRVNHRRPDLTRTREVYGIDADTEDDGREKKHRRATIEIDGEGGLYIKELLHGDSGRTDPSLAALLDIDIEVRALDVTGVEAEDGAFADPAYLRGAADAR